MKHKILGISMALAALTLVSCNDFLTRNPLDRAEDKDAFWSSETSVRHSVYNLYPTYFPGYRSGWNRSDWFAETDIADWTDDNAQQKATFFTKVAPAVQSKSKWSFDDVHVINVMIDRISKNHMEDEARKHWLGVTRFLRALEYAKLVSRFGDVPYYNAPIDAKDRQTLYKARTPRIEVMDSVLADLKYAMANVRIADGENGLTINRDVVYAYATRLLLFEGTWQKYHSANTVAATKYLKAAKEYAEYIINSGKYSLCSNYKALTTSLDLAGNPEIILYRSYVDGEVTHSLMTFQNTEAENASPSKSLIDSYLTKNGLPIAQAGNTQYKGDQWFYDEIADRDPRLYAHIDTTELQLTGVAAVYAISGYFANRFVNETLKNLPGGRSTTCITDAPIMKLNEVLMNYIEAAAELATLGAYTLTQADFDKTINLIRDRPSTAMPHLTLSGNDLQVNGVILNDPTRDSDVPSILWEIRRERRIELAYEGIRFDDLRRWKKLDYADMTINTKLNRGAWIDKTRYVAWYNAHHTKPITLASLDKLILDRPGTSGYILPITKTTLLRTYKTKDYLYPIPVDQLTLYEQNGYTLTQNPGW